MSDVFLMDGDPCVLQAIDGEPEGFVSADRWTLLYRTELEVTTEDTTAARIVDLDIPAEIYDQNKIIYVRIRDKAGKRNGYFFGSDTFFENYPDASGQTGAVNNGARCIHRVTDAGSFVTYTIGPTAGYGVYAYNVTNANKVGINRRYNATYSLIIDGTFTVEVYALIPPKPIYAI